MMTLVPDLPENVVGVSAQGRVSAEDYKRVLIPAVEEALKKQKKIRFFYDLGTEFSGMEMGAMWEDFTFGMGHLRSWERIAVVTDNEWIKHSVQAFGFMMPCPVRVFGNKQKSEAMAWITEPSGSQK